MTTKIPDLAWFAGFFDGEGCIAVADSWRQRKNGRGIRYSTTIILHVRQCELKPLHRIREITQVGKVNERKMKLRPNNWRRQFQWQVGGNQQVRKILEAIRPYTSVKSSQIDTTIELLDTFGKPGQTGKNLLSESLVRQRQALVKKIQALKHLDGDPEDLSTS
jgi:hypothetical protein